MPFQSTFTANLKPLEQAIGQAAPTLNNFEQRTKQIGRGLQTMVSEFDGTKIIQQAALMVGAIDKIGGATKLTEAEQRRVNSSLEAALEKYAALGQAAPRALTDLFNATRKVQTATEELPKKASAIEAGFTKIGTVAAGAVAGITFDRVVGAVTTFAAKTIEAGGAINDLAAKTGVGTSALQRWKFAAEQNGNTLDQLTAATTRLSKGLVEENGGVVGALNQIGLSVETLRNQAPDEAFEAVANAIAKVPDPMRQSALAMEIFGKSGAEILPTMKAGITELGDEAERLGLVMNESTIKALDDLGDSLDKLEAAGQGLIARFMAPAIPLINQLANAAIDAVNRIDDVAEAQSRIALKNPAAGIVTAFGGTPLETQIAALKLLGLALEDVTAPAVRTNTELAKSIRSIYGIPLAVTPADAALSAMSKTIAQQDRDLRKWQQSAEALQRATDAFLGRDLIARANELVRIYQATNRQLPPTLEGQKKVNQELEVAGGILKRVTPAFIELYLRTLPAAVPTLEGIPKFLLEMGTQAQNAIKPVSLLTQEYKALNDVRTGLPSNLPGGLAPTTIPAPPPSLGDRIAKVFGQDIGEQLGQAIIGAATGGGDIGDAIGAVLGQAIGKQLGTAVSKALSKGLGKLGGTVGGIVGAVGGAVAGDIIGMALDKLFKTEGKKVNDLRDQFVLASGGLATLNAHAAEAGITLDRLLKAKNQQQLQIAIIELQNAFAKLEERVKSTLGSLSKLDTAGGLLGGQLAADLLKFSGRADVREALGSFLESQGERTIGGLNTFLKNSQISSASSASSLEGAILSQFGALTQQGASPLEAIEKLGPAIEAFGLRTQEVVGYQAGPAFASMQAIIALTKDEIAGPAIAAVGGLGNALVGLHNQGLLTQDTFGGFTRQIYDTFHGLEVLGKGGVDAARSMQQPLQRTWELVTDFGYTVDDDTAKLLEFAESSGLIGDKFRPAEDKLASAIDRLTGQLGNLAKMFEQTLVSSAYTGARGIENALNGIRPGPIRLDVDINGDLPGVPGFATGSGGLVNFGRGTLAMLHGREAVLTEAQLAALSSTNGGAITVQIYEDSELRASRTFSAARRLIRMQGH